MLRINSSLSVYMYLFESLCMIRHGRQIINGLMCLHGRIRILFISLFNCEMAFHEAVSINNSALGVGIATFYNSTAMSGLLTCRGKVKAMYKDTETVSLLSSS